MLHQGKLLQQPRMLPIVHTRRVDECEQNLWNRLVQHAEMLAQHVQLGYLSSKCVSVAVR
jgi:hypothetical protein